MSQRRSTRLEMTPIASGSASKDYEPDCEECQSEEDVKKPRASMKRKAVDESEQTKVVKPPPAKKARGKRGLLKNVVAMPLDVIFEIFGRLTPLDLWHLAQTSKELRGMLMSRSSVSIWKEARLNYPGLPDCPNDLSEPQYAVLSFAKHCLNCMRNVIVTHTFWDARIRLCTKCVESQCSLHIYMHNIQSSLRPWIPSVDVAKKTGRRRVKEYFYTPLIVEWEKTYEEFMSGDEGTAWVQKTIEERKIIRTHSLACSAWFKIFQEGIDTQKASLLDQRREHVVERARQLGWSEELDASPIALEAIQHSSTVTRACNKDITERVMTSLEDHIDDLMTQARSKRINEAFESSLRERLPILKKIREEYVKTISPTVPCPSAGQLFRMPMVHDLIINTPTSTVFTKESLRPVVDALPELILQWQEESRIKFLNMIKDAHDAEYMIDEDTIFDLATTFFVCTMCPGRYIRYPRVMAHMCLRDTCEGFHTKYEKRDTEERVVRNVLHEGRWNEVGQIKFNLDLVKALGGVVELCGFDQHATTAKEIDGTNPILECLPCHNTFTGRATMAWSTVMFHRGYVHSGAYSGSGGKRVMLKLLDEPDASVVRPQLVIEQEKQQAIHPRLICATCHLEGRSAELRKHFKKDHGNVPTAKDILPLLDFHHTLDVYRLWPPRDEDEHELLVGTEMK